MRVSPALAATKGGVVPVAGLGRMNGRFRIDKRKKIIDKQ
jgi:hypothetical protein